LIAASRESKKERRIGSNSRGAIGGIPTSAQSIKDTRSNVKALEEEGGEEGNDDEREELKSGLSSVVVVVVVVVVVR